MTCTVTQAAGENRINRCCLGTIKTQLLTFICKGKMWDFPNPPSPLLRQRQVVRQGSVYGQMYTDWTDCVSSVHWSYS